MTSHFVYLKKKDVHGSGFQSNKNRCSLLVNKHNKTVWLRTYALDFNTEIYIKQKYIVLRFEVSDSNRTVSKWWLHLTPPTFNSDCT